VRRRVKLDHFVGGGGSGRSGHVAFLSGVRENGK
jgi:hypothetical protein